MYKIKDNIYVKDTGNYGKSLYAKRDFKKDEIVFVAYGPIIDYPTIYAIPINYDLKIDPTRPEGNICQYICHSCEPNLGIKERSLFVAFKDIKKDEEITIDYAMIGYEYTEEMTKENRVCACGSKICRGKLGCYKELSYELKRKYKGYISTYLLDL